MLLKEIGNNPLKYYKLQTFLEKVSRYGFRTSGGNEIEVEIYVVNFNQFSKNVRFYVPDIVKEGKGMGVEFEHMGVADVAGITKTGDEIEVFSTVGDIVIKSIKRLDPSYIFFSAKEPSRQKLYDRFSKKLQIMFGLEERMVLDNGVKFYFLIKSEFLN